MGLYKVNFSGYAIVGADTEDKAIQYVDDGLFEYQEKEYGTVEEADDFDFDLAIYGE